MVALYDVSALLALLDEDHAEHDSVSSWFAANIDQGWASCPLTQNGFLRIVSQSRYPSPISLPDALRRLRSAVSTQFHQFISDDISILDGARVDLNRLSGQRQLTDVYLLALAVAHGAQLVTLDTRIPLGAVIGATEEHLVVI